MSQLLSKKGDKYNVWTTVTNSWLLDKWVTETELKTWIAKEAELEYKKNLIKKLWLFPEGWHGKDRQVYFTDNATRYAYYEWELGLYSDEDKSYATYERRINDKLQVLTSDLPAFDSF